MHERARGWIDVRDYTAGGCSAGFAIDDELLNRQFDSAGALYSGTWLTIGLIVRRYAYTDFKSSSVAFRYAGHGIGGFIGRDTPICRPVRIVCMNISSVQIPRPVFCSGVRLKA